MTQRLRGGVETAAVGFAVVVAAALLMGAVAAPAAAQSTSDSAIDSATAEVTETSIWGDGATEVTFTYQADQGETVELSVPGQGSTTQTSDGAGEGTVSTGNWFSGASYPLDVSITVGDETCAGTLDAAGETVNLCDSASDGSDSDVTFETEPTAEVSSEALWGGVKEISLQGSVPENAVLQVASDTGDSAETLSVNGGEKTTDLDVGNWFQGQELPIKVAARTDDQLCLGTLTEADQQTQLDCAPIQDDGSIGSQSDSLSTQAPGDSLGGGGFGDLGNLSMGDSFGAIGNLSGFGDVLGGGALGIGFNAWAESGYFQIGSGAPDGNEKRVIRAPDCPLGEPANESKGCVKGEGVITGFDLNYVVPEKTIQYPQQTIYSEVLERNVNFQISIPGGLNGQIDLTSLNTQMSGKLQVRVLPSESFGEECGFTVPFTLTSRTSGSSDTNIGQVSGEGLWLSVLRSGNLFSADTKMVTAEYAVPGASGCGTFNKAVNNELDLPSPQGENKAAFNWYLELDPLDQP